MSPAIIRNFDAVVGASQGYTPLPIRHATMTCTVGGDVPVVESEWELTEEEVRMIVEGGRIRLSIQGVAQPPVLLQVIDPIVEMFA